MLKGRACDDGGICGREEVCAGLSPLAALVRRDASILDEVLHDQPDAATEHGDDRDGGWLWRLSREIFRRRHSP